MLESNEAIWKALSDSSRRTVLHLLRDGPKTTGEIAKHFDQTRFAIMKHLSALEDAGLLKVERRGRERWNYLNAATLETALQDWVTPFQKDWAKGLNRLKTRLEEEHMTHSEVLGLDIRQSVDIAASKEQVQHMILSLLELAGTPGADAADALAVALCHAHQRETRAVVDRSARLAGIR